MKTFLFILLFLPAFFLSQNIHYQYECNFEDTCSIIKIDTSTSNLWEIGTPSKIILDTSYSSNKAIITDSINNYPINNHSKFEIHLAEAPNEVLIKFKYKLDTDTLKDGFYIDLLYDTTIGWINAADSFPHPTGNMPFAYSFENLYTLDDTLYNGTYGMSGSSNGWKEAKILLTWYWPVKQYSEVIDTLIFRFNFISDDIHTNKEGMMIDDIFVIAPIYSSINKKLNELIKVYPSPSSSLINLELNQLKNFDNTSIQLINNLGQIVLDQSVFQKKSQLSIAHLPKGLYHVILKKGDNIIGTAKVVKE